MNMAGIFPRRYFYPSLNKLPFVNRTNMPVAEQISASVMCLPLYVGLKENDLKTIVNIINKAIL
jgi:dTDP-4-amino-4,6-dideoxygalactose transaminase